MAIEKICVDILKKLQETNELHIIILMKANDIIYKHNYLP